jgi:hypothetical protein
MVNNNYLNIFENNPTVEDLVNHPKWSEFLSSEVFVYQLLNRTNFNDFQSLPKEILVKPAIILSSLEKFHINKQSIPGNLSKDISFCMYCCNLEPKYMELFHDLVEMNEDLATWYANEFKSIAIAQFLPKKYLSNQEFGLLLIKNNINNYSYLDYSLRNNLAIYQSLSFQKRIKIYRYTGENISNNWSISKDVIISDPESYQYANETLQTNPKFYLDILKKIKNTTLVKSLLKNAHSVVQDNEHCVWQTCLKEPTSLCFSSKRLLNSVSFAQQVILSMNSTQISSSFEYWEEHVLNSGLILDELLPRIIEANCLSMVGSSLKSNQGFMLKALLIDSKQALDACSPVLLSRPEFIINAYNTLDDKNLHKDRYDEHSEQSQVFNYIPEKCMGDEQYLITLYKEFKDIFISIIYPKIKTKDNALIHFLNLSNQTHDGLHDALEKMLLKDNLDHSLVNNNLTSSKKKNKL